MLDDILARLESAPESDAAALREQVLEQTKNLVWVPNPGPQTYGYFSEADELYYGGEAGGGKTDLVVGLALTQHQNSLILRRLNGDARSLAERMLEIVGNSAGWNGQLLHYRKHPLAIDFAGCQHEKDKQNFKGKPHDLIAFDEIPDFLESQYRFIIGWNRSANKDQRCRVVCTGNPPTTAEGLWVIQYWGPWLDPTHPNPAKEGELRWYTTGADGRDMEVDGSGPHMINGEEVYARSRTFIRARLSDNPDLAETNYASVLSALPPELRDAYRDGKFDKSMQDNPWQCIPTAWIVEAQKRWTAKPPAGIPMCAIGVDVAQGGADNNVLAIRHDAWFAPLIKIEGVKTPVGTDTAGVIVGVRRDNALITIDCGGGYGGSAYKHMKDNGIEAFAYKGAEASNERTADGLLSFANVRTAAYWKFRDALDPGQRGGSMIALPPGQRLLSDLSAPRYDANRNVIRLEPKDELVKRLGRSVDEGDAVVMSWYRGPRMSSDYGQWQGRRPGARRSTKVNLGHSAARRSRR